MQGRWYRRLGPLAGLAIGRPAKSDGHDPDIDIDLLAGRGFARKDGRDF